MNNRKRERVRKEIHQKLHIYKRLFGEAAEFVKHAFESTGKKSNELTVNELFIWIDDKIEHYESKLNLFKGPRSDLKR